MQTIADMLKDEGRVEGLAEGRKRDPTRLLERRFAPLPRDVRERIADADHTRLDQVPDAESPGAIFGD